MSRKTTFVRKVLPVIFTVVNVGMTVAAVIFAAKEGPKFKKALEEKEMKPSEKILTGAKIFAPAIGCALASSACAIGGVCLNFKTQSVLLGMVASSNELLKQYRAKNEEVNGEDADKKVMTEIAKDKLPENLKAKADSDETMIFHDCITGQMFESTMAKVIEAEYQINRELHALDSGFMISLNRYCELFGMKSVSGGDDEGWSLESICEWGDAEHMDWLDFMHEDFQDTDGTLVTNIVPSWPSSTDYKYDEE